jgi:hypothetical protein
VRLHETETGEVHEAAEQPKVRPDDHQVAQRALAANRPETLAPPDVLHLQRTAGNTGVQALLSAQRDEESPVADLLSSRKGAALDGGVRSEMEDRLGHDFSDVRVHTGAEADASARSVQAHAYTVGNDVVFANGKFDPSSTGGKETLAHELTHVVQQRSGPVDGTPAPGGISLSDPSDRFERDAEQTAHEAMSGEPATAQREAAEEEEELPTQTLAVQRAGSEEEDLEEPPA